MILPEGCGVLAEVRRGGNARLMTARPCLPFHFYRPAVPSAVPEMPSVFIKTYGCQMNERDSEAVAAQLMAKGYAVAPDEAQAM